MNQRYEWPLVDEFRDREAALDRLEAWWADDERMPVALYGRRRIGKSWLLRRFAHGKPAIVIVADQVTPDVQLQRFAAKLEPILGVQPHLPDLATLFRVLFQAAASEKLLVAIDEFPYLLPTSKAEAEEVLSTLLVVMEEAQGASKLKLVLSGSAVAQMESLFAERNPLHGRLVPQELRSLNFGEASLLLEDLGPVERFERFAVTGGMPRYLALLRAGSLRASVCDSVLDRDSPLWDEPRAVLDQELRQPQVYFSILERLATGRKETNEIAQALHLETSTLTSYLNILKNLRLVHRYLPVGAARSSRTGQWQLEDSFMRFWFRFVFPYQAELESGLRPEDLFDAEIAEALADHVAPVFEDWCRSWVRRHQGKIATKVGAWWGPALNRLRRTGERTSEEIDIVGLARNRVQVIAEAKWTSGKLGARILRDLEDYKIPALRQAGLKLAATPRIILFSKSGYSAELERAARADENLTLVDVERALGEESVPTGGTRRRSR